MTKDDILNGQTAWQSTGGMQVGSVWGHGSYQAPDWSSDWLHRELTAWLDLAAQETAGVPFAQLDADRQIVLKHQLKTEYRRNPLNSPEARRVGHACVSPGRPPRPPSH